MGYVLKKRTFLLQFEDCEDLSFEDLEVRCRSTSMAKYFEIIDLTQGGNQGDYADKREHRMVLASEFAKLLVSWNLQDEDGNDVPATAAGLFDQEEYFMAKLFSAWVEAVASVPAPLGQRSDAGERSVAPSMETVSLSADLENSLMPIS
jgi:hypothetical protein